MKHLLLIIALCLYSHSTQAGNCDYEFRLLIKQYTQAGATVLYESTDPLSGTFIINDFVPGDSIVFTSPYILYSDGNGCNSYYWSGLISQPSLYMNGILRDTLVDWVNYLGYYRSIGNSDNRDHHWQITQSGYYEFYWGWGALARMKITIIVNGDATGVQNTYINSNIRLFSDAQKNLIIYTDMPLEKIQVSLYNTNGTLVSSNNNIAINTNISLAHLPQGIYFCTIRYYLHEKQYYYTQKIVRL